VLKELNMTDINKIVERIESWKNKLTFFLKPNYSDSVNSNDLSTLMKKDSNGNNCNKKILVESYGLNMHLNNFYLVLRESEHSAVISEVKNDINPKMTGLHKNHDLQLVNKSSINNETLYHLNDHSLTEWQGNPLELSFA
jgi:hypothetical protein